MEYLPYQITVDDKVFAAAQPADGRIYVKVGKLDICINQSDDEQGIMIDCYNAETEEHLDGMAIWNEDINE